MWAFRDRPGDALVRELRSLFPSLPIVIATGQSGGELHSLLTKEPGVVSVQSPIIQMI
jgi:hypothetical protein